MEYTKDFIEKLYKGDRVSQRILYEAISAKMYAVCLRYVNDKEIARDVLHDGFIKVFTAIKSYRGEGSFEGWVRRIVVNTALEYLRKRKDQYEVNIDSAKFIEVENRVEGYDYKFFLNIITELPSQYRTVFNMYAIDEYSHAEIADLLNITESTSKSNYSRAKAILRTKLEKLKDFKYEEFIR